MRRSQRATTRYGNAAATACEPACESRSDVCRRRLPGPGASPAGADPPPTRRRPPPPRPPRSSLAARLPRPAVHRRALAPQRHRPSDPGARLGSFLGGRLNETVLAQRSADDRHQQREHLTWLFRRHRDGVRPGVQPALPRARLAPPRSCSGRSSVMFSHPRRRKIRRRRGHIVAVRPSAPGCNAGVFFPIRRPRCSASWRRTSCARSASSVGNLGPGRALLHGRRGARRSGLASLTGGALF